MPTAGEQYAGNPPKEQPAQAEAQPAPPATSELSLRAGSAVDEGGNATFTVTADPAPQSDLTIAWTVAESGDYRDTGPGRNVCAGLDADGADPPPDLCNGALRNGDGKVGRTPRRR